MKLFYFHVASDVPQEIKPDAAVVIDVLRATTTIAWALNNGAEAVQTFEDLNELKQSSMEWPNSQRILLGERGGKCIDGFDLGNSPLGVSADVVKNKRLFMSTTNGTRSLQRVRHAKTLFTMSLPNRKAVAERLIKEKPKVLWILGSGWEGSYSLEDSFAAGALASVLLENLTNLAKVANDELTSALALWHQWKSDPEALLRTATHGQRLIGIGNHDNDFKCCSELDNLTVVPTQVEPGVLRAG